MAKEDDYRRLIDEIVEACIVRSRCMLGVAPVDEYEAARDRAAETLAGLSQPDSEPQPEPKPKLKLKLRK